jgi:hypothetical protein
MKFTSKRAKIGAALLALGATATVLAGCSAPSSNTVSQQTTEQFSKTLSNAQPYPLSQMQNSDERANLRERLLRMNDPNKIGYFYELTQNGQVIAQYTVKGKISSTQSQLTNSNYALGNAYNGSVVDSMGDDGSYGPEEGGQNGIFFFTTSGVLVEWDGLWQYSDAPLNLTSKPLITMDETQKPTSSAGQLK